MATEEGESPSDGKTKDDEFSDIRLVSEPSKS